jgi:hypothetical protein
MRLFYAIAPTKIVFQKRKYNKLWKVIGRGETLSVQQTKKKNDIYTIIVCKMWKFVANTHLLQSAVFSEYVYARTLTNIFRLPKLTDYKSNPSIDGNVLNLLISYYLVPRYIHSNKDKTEFLIKAGGIGGTDIALIHLMDKAIYSIEFKARRARAITALPKYGEDSKNYYKVEIPANLDKMQQLSPCITAKMLFDNLKYGNLIEHYKEDLQ